MIPDYQTCMLPLLKYAGDNNEHKFSDAVDYLSNEFNLSQEERKELLPSKTQDVITNRIGWARTYMKKAGLLTPKMLGLDFSKKQVQSLKEMKKDKIFAKIGFTFFKGGK